MLPLGTPTVTPTEYRLEHIAKVWAVDDDPTELRMEILDTSKSGFGCEIVRFCCEARTSLLTALLNRLDDMNGIGTSMQSRDYCSICMLPMIDRDRIKPGLL